MARATAAQRAQKQLDKQIEQIYYRHGSGVQINIMNINEIFKAGHKAVAEGADLEQVIIDAIAKWREN